MIPDFIDFIVILPNITPTRSSMVTPNTYTPFSTNSFKAEFAPQISSRASLPVSFTHHPPPLHPIAGAVPSPKSASELGIFLHCIAKGLHQPSGETTLGRLENMSSQPNRVQVGKSSTNRLVPILWDILVSRRVYEKKLIHIVLVVSQQQGICR